jgi:cysteinyl-tRNA synthetase
MPADAPPGTVDQQAGWAAAWARVRAAAKGRRDFSEADRIRAMLLSHGWEVRDRKDGTSEVFRK